jgi:hypothetical protein
MMAELGKSRVIESGLLFERAGAVAAVVLAIIALAGVWTADLLCVAILGLGVSFLFEGGAVGARFSRLLARTKGRSLSYAEVGGGLTAEFMAGAVGIILGILALVGVASETLSAIAVLLFGGAMLLGSGAMGRLSFLEITAGQSDEGLEHLAHDVVSLSTGAQLLTGLGAAILGILALVGFNPPILCLAAVLCIGVAMILNGTLIGARICGLISTSAS